jgi:subtilisin family serine protease
VSRRAGAYRILAAVVLGLALVTAPSQAAAAVPPPERMVDAVVVLRAQADLGAIRAATRPGRLAAVERALRDTAAGAQRGVLRLLARRQQQQLVERVTPLWIVDEVGVRAAPSVLRELATRPDVVAVRPDLALSAPAPLAVTGAPAEDNIARVGAAKLWELGYRGQGTVVATMDTGVDLGHPDLAGRWRGGTNSWYDPNGQHPGTPVDLNGHGTRTMSVIVGGDGGGTSIGMAPDARWIAVKIFNDRGMASSTAIHSGFQWLLDPDRDPATADAPNVVDNSWSMSSGGCLLDFQLDLRSLRAAGILPVFSAGNYGPSTGTVLSPANNPEAFAVGSTDDLDVVDPSSSRGPSACPSAVAPRLTAPGVGIRTADLYGLYIDSTGTSVAAPHVAGALSLLLSALPGLPADRQEAALVQGALDLGAAGWDPAYGYGRLDVAAAYQWLASAADFTLTASPASAAVLPGGSATYAVTVAGSNGFADGVALSVAGLPAGAGASIVPAVVPGGAGTAQVTVGTPASLAPGTYSLTLTGTSGALVRTAPVTLVVAPPPDFGLTVTPAALTVAAGGTGTATVGVAALNGFAADVALSVTGLPAEVGTAAVTPAVVGVAGTAQLPVTVRADAPAGSYPVTVTATGGGLSHTAAVTVVVPPRDIAVSVSPASRTVTRPNSTSYTVTVSPVNGFTGSVSLTVSGLPYRSTAVLSATPLPVPGSRTLTIRTTTGTTRGTFTLTVTATAGTLSRQATVTLVVR